MGQILYHAQEKSAEFRKLYVSLFPENGIHHSCDVGCIQLSVGIHIAPEAQALLKRIEIREAERFTEAYPDKWGCLLTVHTKDGRTFTHEIPSASGSIDNPLTPAQARAKSAGLMESVIGRENAEALCDTLLRITELETLPDLY